VFIRDIWKIGLCGAFSALRGLSQPFVARVGHGVKT
jgi:hypothetical protein